MPKLNIIILNYNSAIETIELYNQLIEISVPENQIIVVDNASNTSDIELLKELIPVKNLILNEKNIGYASANNIAIAEAVKNKVQYVWILNPDIRIEKETLPILLNTIMSDSDLAAVGPRILKGEEKNIIFSDGAKINFDRTCETYHINYLIPEKLAVPHNNSDVDYIDGSCILINLKAIESVGYLPEEYFLYFEETDWCTKAKRKGWKLAVNPAAKAFNKRSSRSEIYQYYMYRNRLIFSRKYHPNYSVVRLYYIKELAKAVFLQLIGVREKPYLKSRIRGVWDALKN